MNHGIVWIHALTPLHNGSGQGLGAIDRPIIREAHTHFPYIQGSTLKGAARANAKVKHPGSGTDDSAEVTHAFGKGEISGNQGAISWPEASIVLFPVQSLVGTFVWTTCPFVLARLYRDLSIHAPEIDLTKAVCELLHTHQPDFPKEEALDCAHQPNGQHLDAVCRLNGKGNFILRNRVLKPATAGSHEAWSVALNQIADELAEVFMDPNDPMKHFFKGRLVLVHDEVFTDFVKHGTAIEANIAMEDTGVTKDGSLRYTEFLPAESVLYSPVTAEKSYKDANFDAAQIENLLIESLKLPNAAASGAMQLGADESKGKGVVRMRYTQGTGTRPAATPPDGAEQKGGKAG